MDYKRKFTVMQIERFSSLSSEKKNRTIVVKKYHEQRTSYTTLQKRIGVMR